MKCTCTIRYNTSGPMLGQGEIIYCSLHAAAPEMLEALENMIGCINETGALATMYFDHARAIIKKAKAERS